MKHDDFTWDDIILEAPEDDDLEDDELSASDYSEAEDMDIEEGEPEVDPADEDPLAGGAEDYTAEPTADTEEGGEPAEDGGDGGDEDPLAGDPADEDPLADDGTDGGNELDGGDEDPLAGDPADEDPLAEDGEGGEGSDENPEDKQTDNTESDVVSDKQNINLVNDYIELYTRIDTIMQQIRTDCKTNIRYNPNMLTVRRNLEKLKEITYDYIVNKFTKETYVANLYQFNLIIQALNTNIDLLASVLASNRKNKEANSKDKKKKVKKEDNKKKR